MPRLSVETSYKPVVAVIFAIILAVAGVWSSRRRPWRGGKDGTAMAKAFMITSMPFVLAEAVTGAASLLTEQLSIPPVVGVSTAVNLAILLAGIVVAIFWTLRSKPLKAGEAGTARQR